MPNRFGIARILGLSYALRCVVFHDISVSESPFTRGMRVTMPPSAFEAALKFFARYYTPVRLQDVLDAADGRSLPRRPVLVTFDDGYASTMECAVPLCRKYGVPGIVFLNAAFLDNEGLAPDNLVCFVANVLGMEAINAAVRAVGHTDAPKLKSLAEVFSSYFPSISLSERRVFLNALTLLGGFNDHQLAREAGLYLTRKQVGELAASGFEIGNHTYTHVHGRSLAATDFGQEIGGNKAELEALSRKKVRSFSLPYGSSVDLTNDLVHNLQLSGHEAVFLSESVANPRGAECFRIDRVSVHARKDDAFFLEIEVLPHLRAVRNWFSRGFDLVRTVRRDAFSSRWGGTWPG